MTLLSASRYSFDQRSHWWLTYDMSQSANPLEFKSLTKRVGMKWNESVACNAASSVSALPKHQNQSTVADTSKTGKTSKAIFSTISLVFDFVFGKQKQKDLSQFFDQLLYNRPSFGLPIIHCSLELSCSRFQINVFSNKIATHPNYCSTCF